MENVPWKAETPKQYRIRSTDDSFRAEVPLQPFSEGLILLGYNEDQAWRINAHHHEFFELCYVDQGTGWFSVNNDLYPVRQGDIFLTKPAEIHEGASTDDHPFCLYYLAFTLEQAKALEMDYYQIGANRVIADRDNKMKLAMDEMMMEVREETDYHIQMVQGIFLQFLVRTLRLYKERKEHAQSECTQLTPVIRKLLDYLHSGNDWHTVDQLAEKFHMSRSHLDHEFKTRMGTPLGHYIRSLRSDRAKYFLRETDLSVTAISEKLEFDSIHKFSMFFKKATGRSPHHYRKDIASLR